MFERTKSKLSEWTITASKKAGNNGRKKEVMAFLAFINGTGDKNVLTVCPDTLYLRGFDPSQDGRLMNTSWINTVLRDNDSDRLLFITRTGSEYTVSKAQASITMKFLCDQYMNSRANISAAIKAAVPFYN